MGGHGHGHHHEPYTIPDYKIYDKVDEIPELKATKDALACKGLKDPWLRNEVWRYDRKIWGTEGSRARAFFLRGARTGFAAFVLTIAGTALYDKMYPSEHGHDDHH